MAILFESNAGRVLAVPDRSAAGCIQVASVIGNERISYIRHNTIITKMGLSAAGNYQFAHMIGNDIYVYVFGDRMGQIVLHGISFSNQCPYNQGTPHGFEYLLRWYAQNRIAARKFPVRVIIGANTPFEGFLVGINSEAGDPESRTISFQLTLAVTQ